jgi:hypothetical protein
MSRDARTVADGPARSAPATRKVRLPWYDFEFLWQDHRRLWEAVRDRLVDSGMAEVPRDLTSDPDLDRILASPELLLSQTCGYDIAVPCPTELRPVLTPVYAAPGCGEGTYSSYVVVARGSKLRDLGDLAHGRFVANDDRSWSGFHCVRELGVTWTDVQFSGSHLRSLARLARAEADWAAIDAVVWALLGDHDRSLHEQFRILAVTREVPAPPLVTSMQIARPELDRLRDSLQSVIADPALRATLRRLRIAGFVELDRSAYAFMDLDRRPRRRPGLQTATEDTGRARSSALYR